MHNARQTSINQQSTFANGNRGTEKERRKEFLKSAFTRAHLAHLGPKFWLFPIHTGWILIYHEMYTYTQLCMCYCFCIHLVFLKYACIRVVLVIRGCSWRKLYAAAKQFSSPLLTITIILRGHNCARVNWLNERN